MEPEVHIIEKYFQEILHCFTMTNIKCKGNKEIDLLVINPQTLQKWHVESRVSTTFNLRKNATYTKRGTCHRNGVDFFIKEKFNHPTIREKIVEIFGHEEYYQKILVVWDIFDRSIVPWSKTQYDLNICFMSDFLRELMQKRVLKGSRDDVLRTVELLQLCQKKSLTWTTPW